MGIFWGFFNGSSPCGTWALYCVDILPQEKISNYSTPRHFNVYISFSFVALMADWLLMCLCIGDIYLDLGSFFYILLNMDCGVWLQLTQNRFFSIWCVLGWMEDMIPLVVVLVVGNRFIFLYFNSNLYLFPLQ